MRVALGTVAVATLTAVACMPATQTLDVDARIAHRGMRAPGDSRDLVRTRQTTQFSRPCPTL